MLAVRRIYKSGGSLTFSIPRGWEVPEYLNVYGNGEYFLYTPLTGIEDDFRVRRVAVVKQRKRRIRGRTYSFLTIPKPLAEMQGIEPGSTVLLVKDEIGGEPSLIGITSMHLLHNLAKSLLGK